MNDHYDSLAPYAGLNYVELTPISILARASQAYPNHPAIIYGKRQYTWSDLANRAKRLASGLQKLGVARGTTVSFIACLLYTSPSPRDKRQSRMPSSA